MNRECNLLLNDDAFKQLINNQCNKLKFECSCQWMNEWNYCEVIKILVWIDEINNHFYRITMKEQYPKQNINKAIKKSFLYIFLGEYKLNNLQVNKKSSSCLHYISNNNILMVCLIYYCSIWVLSEFCIIYKLNSVLLS